MAKVSKSRILAYNKCADLVVKWTNILDSFWHKDEKIPLSALEQMPIANNVVADDLGNDQPPAELDLLYPVADHGLNIFRYTDEGEASGVLYFRKALGEWVRIPSLEVLESLYLRKTDHKPSNWETTPNGNLKTKVPSKLAINKQEAEYALDVANSPDIEHPFTGTLSFDGFMFNGIGTLFLSEYQTGYLIKVISTGEVYVPDFLWSDTQGMADGSNYNTFSNEACIFIQRNGKLVNLMNLLKFYKNEWGSINKDNNEFKKNDNQYSIVRNSAPNGGGGYHNIEDKVDIKVNTSYQKQFKSPLGNFSMRFNDSYGLAKMSLEYMGGGVRTKISIDSNSDIKVEGLKTTNQGANILYKENGFLKIG
jgi:hypothetical protein